MNRRFRITGALHPSENRYRGDFYGSHGPIPLRRLQPGEILPHSQAFYTACLAAGFPQDPDQNHPESTGILFDGKRARGVEAESGGQRFTVEANQIVLSAGAIASPHLLLLSSVGPAEHLRSLGGEGGP